MINSNTRLKCRYAVVNFPVIATRKFRILFILNAILSIPSFGFAQLDSIEGYWLSQNQSDTAVLMIKDYGSNRKANIQGRKGLKSSTAIKNDGVFYFTFDNDSLSIIDAYGNIECKSKSFIIDSEKLEINGACKIYYTRITKKQYSSILRMIETTKQTRKKTEPSNPIDY